MGIVVIDRPVFTAKVTLNTSQLQGSFDVSFVAHRYSELREMEKRALKEHPLLNVLPMVVVGHQPIELGGKLVQFEANAPTRSLEQMADWPGMVSTMVRRYYDALAEEGLGNSARLPDGPSSSPMTEMQGQPPSTRSPELPSC